MQLQIWIWLGLALVVGLIFLLFFTNNPDIAQVELAPEPVNNITETNTSPLELMLTQENVQEIIAALQQPEHYQREIRQTRFWDGSSGTRQAEIWVSPDAMRISWDNGEHMLFTAQYYYFWFQTYETIRRQNPLTEEENLQQTFDAFAGVSSYGHFLTRDTSEILTVEQGNLEIQGSVYFVIIVSAIDGAFDLRDYYFICANTGLLLKMETYDDEQLVYRFETTSLRIGDIDSSVFIAP